MRGSRSTLIDLTPAIVAGSRRRTIRQKSLGVARDWDSTRAGLLASRYCGSSALASGTCRNLGT